MQTNPEAVNHVQNIWHKQETEDVQFCFSCYKGDLLRETQRAWFDKFGFCDIETAHSLLNGG